MSRITDIIERLEAGDVIAPADLRRIAQLQALDVAKAGEDFLAGQRLREKEADERFARFLDYQ